MNTRISRYALGNVTSAARREPRTRSLIALLVFLVSFLTPPATAARASNATVRETATADSTTDNAAFGDSSVLETERGKIVMSEVIAAGGLKDLSRNFAGVWEPINVPTPELRKRFAELLEANWGDREEGFIKFEVLNPWTLERSNPKLYRELTSKTAIKPGDIILQGVGHNAPQVKKNGDKGEEIETPKEGFKALHTEIILLKLTVKAKYIADSIKAGSSDVSIDKSLKKLERELTSLGEGNDYRDRLARAVTRSGNSTTLSPTGLTVKQPCGSISNGRCSPIARALDFAVPYGNSKEIEISAVVTGLVYGKVLLRYLADALQAGNRADATTYASGLVDIAAAVQSRYRDKVSNAPSWKQNALLKPMRAVRARLRQDLYNQEIKLRMLDEKELADTVHGALLKVNSRALSRKKMQEIADESKEGNENLGVPGCSKPRAMGRPVEGHGLVSMALLPMAVPCPGKASDGLTKALASNDYGGVDFSTVQLRYLSDDPGSGVRYSLSGRAAPPGLQQDMDSSIDAVVNSTADLRTWLVLSPDKFWVNLNPDEPDRIIDPDLGQTNAGRALLEADQQMKYTASKLMNPQTDFGAQYWDAIAGSSGKACFTSRLWIVPGDVEVREDGSSLYILKATLAVKTQATHVAMPSRWFSCRSNPQVDARSEHINRTMLVPKITQAINTAPEYAAIRRAFVARIVAQWIRKRHQEGHHTSFDGLIDSGKLGPSKLQNGWRPQQVYDVMLRMYQNGGFAYKRTVRKGGTVVTSTVMTGGVDFSNLYPKRLSASATNRQYPHLPQTAKSSTHRPTTASDGSIWLGVSTESPGSTVWTRTMGTTWDFLTGRVGVLILLLVALGLLAFGIRSNPSRRRRKIS
ncbi:hypothetical protein [Actinoallomurus rhizosphaericola]|uniref:hypothetical protein n=1 Tax=Actinoallomurus rhizosphaericola TaxID=2952536 RepID=UPI00209317FC|nr:hypothetical protein [Actinoallomurus rhizosphaericola]MCO5999268.1 hypothetical protein [Actinoallomurus rhizosphaericola]